jgi:hypothetical protein
MKQALRYHLSNKITPKEINNIVYILNPISHAKKTLNETSRNNNSSFTATKALQITAPNNNTVMRSPKTTSTNVIIPFLL